MLERVVLISLIYFSLFFFDMTKLIKKPRIEIYLYIFIVMISLYLSLKFVFELDWFNMYDLIAVLIGKMAENIVDYLNVIP
ncbi:hypothetical protein EHS13_19000 [Paenibacillus psychroresistens]|uniref:Uncharacterized protein n=1 Tax=Paenibacillus psychroresistens TaxID=1778678 RepID=A0A6B8RN87_9BACL|nr:hypothetical protein [Paenibacillus psychroresistens]QGQ96818.1 hypothetical protein EHS13_19000 [Paenibacillus psychroresistens]